LLYTTAPALAMFARYNLITSLDGAAVESVAEEAFGNGADNRMYTLSKVDVNGEAIDFAWTETWQQTGLLRFDDRDGDGVIHLTPDDATNEVFIDPDIIVLSTPEVANLAPWVIALVAAGGLAAALSTAAGLLLVISSSIAHDIYYRLINPEADEARRVLVGRAFVLVGILVAGFFGVNPPGFVAEVVAFAFGLAASSFFPIILLGIFDPRTNREGAIVGMLVGLGFTSGYIIGAQFYDMPLWCFGISAQGIGAVGMALNFVATLGVSRVTPPPPQEIRDMVESLRHPDHPGPAVILDEATE
jgi:cation/acetate symporter